jgi:predicted nucleotidyltransferase
MDIINVSKRIERIQELIKSLQTKTFAQEEVLAFIVYGSFSESSDHKPTKFSDVDLEIVVKAENYNEYLNKFRSWFETNFETVLIETSVGHLEKIFVTQDFVDLQFHISQLSDFNNIEKREMNYFPNGYTLSFDKTGKLDVKIKASLKLKVKKTPQQRFDELNNAFWYFALGIPPFFERKEYWYAASCYWAWLYSNLCKLLRMYYKVESKSNPFKHIEEALNKDVIEQIQPLRNLETTDLMKQKMNFLMDLFTEYAHRIADENSLIYHPEIGEKVRRKIKPFLL